MNIRGIEVTAERVVVTVFGEDGADRERYLRWASVPGGDSEEKAEQLTAVVRNGTADIEPRVEVTVFHAPSLSVEATLPYQVGTRTLHPAQHREADPEESRLK